MLELSLPSVLEPLKHEKRFVAWNLEDRNGKATKVPYSPITGGRAASNDPSTWGAFQDAADLATVNRYTGVGVMLGSGLVGVDLDHVITEGVLNPEAARIVKQLASYTEISPSGTGLHILCRTDDTYSAGRRGGAVFTEAAGTPGADLEFYPSGRYFTLTGAVYGEERPIENRTKEVALLHAHYWPKTEAREAAPRTRQAPRIDADVLEQMQANNARAWALYAGDMSAYGDDHSRADMSLCIHLVYWTGGDTEQADRLFRASGLMRPKWDEVHYSSGDTYGEHTLAAANAVYAETVQQFRQLGRAVSADDVERAYGDAAKHRDDTPLAMYLPRIEQTQEEYIAGGAYGVDVACMARHRDAKTGFSAIDRINGFYPGLYVLGATSSLGKTSFALQLADQVAEMGRDVIYISLEQTPAELTAKSIARYAYRISTDEDADPFCNRVEDALPASRLRIGYQTILTDKAADVYRQTAGPHMHIIRGSFRTRTQDVVYRLREWLGEHSGAQPLVVIDYLQALAPADARQTDKQAVDDAIGDLKDVQGANDLTMLVISSLNRANYLAPVSFESFKESGGIEYSADVVWGLDLACLQHPFFEANGRVIEKREIVKLARRECPREVVLQCLKNRFGVSSYSAGFYFDPRHDVFTPAPVNEMGEAVFTVREGSYHDRLKRAAERTGSDKRAVSEARACAETQRTVRQVMRAVSKLPDPDARAQALIQTAQQWAAETRQCTEQARQAARDAEPYDGPLPF